MPTYSLSGKDLLPGSCKALSGIAFIKSITLTHEDTNIQILAVCYLFIKSPRTDIGE